MTQLDIYASCAATSGIIYLLARQAGVTPGSRVFMGIASAFLMRWGAREKVIWHIFPHYVRLSSLPFTGNYPPRLELNWCFTIC